MPLNHTDIDILCLKYKDYTEEELEFNKIKMYEDIYEAHKKLKIYGVKLKELNNLTEYSLRGLVKDAL